MQKCRCVSSGPVPVSGNADMIICRVSVPTEGFWQHTDSELS